MVEGPCKACGKTVVFKVGEMSTDFVIGILLDDKQPKGTVELTCSECGLTKIVGLLAVKKGSYEKRLKELIEHIEDSVTASDIPIKRDTLDLYMNMEDEKEVERLAGDLWQMFRHLRRNCSWFFEGE